MDIKEDAKDYSRDLGRLMDKFKDLQRRIDDLEKENEELKAQQKNN